MRSGLLILVAVVLAGCSATKTPEEIAFQERLASFDRFTTRFTVPSDSVADVRARFRAWVRCYGSFPMATDSETVMETERPATEDGVGIYYKASLLDRGDSTFVTCESSLGWIEASELAVYLRDGLRPLTYRNGPKPCDTVFGRDASAPTLESGS